MCVCGGGGGGVGVGGGGGQGGQDRIALIYFPITFIVHNENSNG